MLQGAHTAIVTPFNKNGSVDYTRYRELIEFQIESRRRSTTKST